MINKPYDPEQMRDFKQLVSRYDTLYSDKVAFKYRKNPKDQKIIEVTYHDFKKDIDSLGTKLIDMGFQGKRIAIIALIAMSGVLVI